MFNKNIELNYKLEDTKFKEIEELDEVIITRKKKHGTVVHKKENDMGFVGVYGIVKHIKNNESYVVTDVSGDTFTCKKNELKLKTKTPKLAHLEAFEKGKQKWKEETEKVRFKYLNQGYEILYDQHFFECRKRKKKKKMIKT
jgi:hypothetical protein